MLKRISPSKSFLYSSLVAGLFSVAGTAFAQEEEMPARGRSQATSEVVVSATRTERELFDVPVSAAVVGEKKMRRETQKTIAEHLRDIPGVTVSDGGMGGAAKQVTIRGESGSRVLILIDGMKISEQKSMNGSALLIDPSNIERLEVIKGPASVLYGSEAIGGVVNIITKKGGKRPIQASLTGVYDSSNESFTPMASVSGTHRGIGYRFSGDYTDAHDKTGASDTTLKGTAYRQHNQSAYLDYGWEKGRVAVGYDTFSARIKVPGAESDGAIVQPDLPSWERNRLYGTFELEQISDYLQKIKLVGFTQQTKKDFTNDIDVHQNVQMGPFPATIDVNSFIDTRNKQRSYGLNLQTDWTLGDSHYVVAGIDYLRDNLKSTEFRDSSTTVQVGPMPPVVTPSVDNGTYLNDAHQETWAIFLQDEWSFAEDWTATLGLRHTWVTSSLDETTDSKLDEGKDSDSHLVASAGLVYSGFDDWRLRANYSQGYKYPLLQQLYLGTVHGGADVTYPNPGLKPETSQSFEIGSRYDANGFVGDFAVFYTMSDDYIYRASTIRNGAKSYMFDNGNSAKTFGTELSLEYTYEPWNLTPYVSGTYLHRELDRGSENGGTTKQTGDARLTGRAGVRFEHEISPTFSIHSDVFARMAATAKEEDTKGKVTEKGGWTTANMSFGTSFGEDRKYFVDVNLNNIFDKQYTPAPSALEDPGFHAVVRMGVEF